uniref:Aminophospholipid ATPase n=1 Tax=Arundo donax TaxID=35708 RepID=A0A0A9H9D5_ARUDO
MMKMILQQRPPLAALGCSSPLAAPHHRARETSTASSDCDPCREWKQL